MVITKLRDVFIPQVCRECKIAKINVPKNPYDIVIFKSPIYIIAELKSGKQKSFSLDEKIIKTHQIKNLNKYKDYKNTFCGFIFNFANYDNQTFFLHINDFNNYVLNSTQKSLPLVYCQKHGIEIKNTIKKVKFKYDIDKLFEDIIQKYTI
jgi:penicillin-binding protein-related factor A (putative recombinase)